MAYVEFIITNAIILSAEYRTKAPRKQLITANIKKGRNKTIFFFSMETKLTIHIIITAIIKYVNKFGSIILSPP